MTSGWLVYGANGFTGQLIAREAVRRGLRPILAGRRASAVAAVAAPLGLAHRAFPLGDPAAVAAGLTGVGAVLHCAGPFVRTSRPMVDACLTASCHYLDITGEVEVFAEVLGRAPEARAAGVSLIPGVGFDVVPTDCLAATLARALPGATHLELAFAGGAGWSRGTLKTMIESFPDVCAELRDGRLEPLAPGAVRRRVPFADGARTATAIRWGDLVTAARTTGVANVRVYAALPSRARRGLRRLGMAAPLLRSRFGKRVAQWWVGRFVTGPGDASRAAAQVQLWGEARGPGGVGASATMCCPEGYTTTALAAVECVVRALQGVAPPGAATPALAFGPELVASLPGVEVGQPVVTSGGRVPAPGTDPGAD